MLQVLGHTHPGKVCSCDLWDHCQDILHALAGTGSGGSYENVGVHLNGGDALLFAISLFGSHPIGVTAMCHGIGEDNLGPTCMAGVHEYMANNGECTCTLHLLFPNPDNFLIPMHRSCCSNVYFLHQVASWGSGWPHHAPHSASTRCVGCM